MELTRHFINLLKEEIIRRSHHRNRSSEPTTRINKRIRAPQIRVIAPDGEQLGVMTPDQGRDHASTYDLDLVEVAPQARPPVCRIMDYGKYRYDQSKKNASSKSARTQLKTIQLRPNTDEHDLDVKLRRAGKFLKQGNQVKFVMRLRGRERAYMQRWIERLREVINEVDELIDNGVRVISSPRGEGWRILAVVEPMPASP